MNNPNGCNKAYYSRLEYASVQLSAIPMMGDRATQLTAKFPRPFQLIGFITAPPEDLPNDGSSPAYPQALLVPEDAGNQNTFSQLNAELMIAFMEANQRDINDVEATVYQSGQFRYYFDRLLNAAQKPKNYNAFLMPSSMMIQYWLEQSALPSSYPTQDLYMFVKDIFHVSDKRMWGAPGTYAINPQVDPDFWTSCGCAAAGGVPGSLNTFLNPPNIDPTIGSAYFFINTGGEDYSGVIFGSATVPYAGTGPATPDWTAFPGAPMTAIVAWVKAVLLAETGDAEGPGTYTVNEVFGVSTCEPCNLGGGLQIEIRAADAYTFGTLALPVEQKFVRVLFSETFSKEPYWTQLNQFIDNFSHNPYFLVAELKSVE